MWKFVRMRGSWFEMTFGGDLSDVTTAVRDIALDEDAILQ